MKQNLRYLLATISSLFVVLLLTQCTGTESYKVENYWNSEQQDSVMFKLMRYIAKPPKRVDNEKKFDPIYDSYYKDNFNNYNLEFYYISERSSNRERKFVYWDRWAIYP
jgi:hypothetical protein